MVEIVELVPRFRTDRKGVEWGTRKPMHHIRGGVGLDFDWLCSLLERLLDGTLRPKMSLWIFMVYSSGGQKGYLIVTGMCSTALKRDGAKHALLQLFFVHLVAFPRLVVRVCVQCFRLGDPGTCVRVKCR